jgi:hypothetical protein
MLGDIVHATFALLMFITFQPMGALHLLVESGFEVVIDGHSAGYTSDAAGGLLLDYVPTGDHDVVLKSPDGASVPLKVLIADGELTTVQVSTLGLHARRPLGKSGTTVVVSAPADDVMALELPQNWKRAVASVLVTGIHVESVRRDGDGEVLGTFTAPDRESMEDFLKALRRHDDVQSVEMIRYGYIANGIRFRILITFLPPALPVG